MKGNTYGFKQEKTGLTLNGSLRPLGNLEIQGKALGLGHFDGQKILRQRFAAERDYYDSLVSRKTWTVL